MPNVEETKRNVINTQGTRREIEKLRLMALIQGQQLLRHFSKNNATRKKQNNRNEPTLSD
ncbi:hypothetical protein OUZ56_028735 [Daphnia magna]|uniref:Uncharacterized protein n=1 Tax=Daphnia magna TaxID=35525 RepID=A0ABR0B4S3_9CRUS|nr:hypothetical protein OUZ56_028735 [Daphnia magna]